MTDDDKRTIPFCKPAIGQAEIDAVVEVMKGGWLTMGPRVKEFESAFASYVQANHAISMNSCTSALFLSLVGLGIGPGDEIITTPFTFAATANTIVHTGARPVFVDISDNSLNINPGLLEDAITDRTRGIIPVHFAGVPVDMNPLTRISKKHDLRVVEDCAHSLGAYYKGRATGTFGDAGCFSFYATKNITTGDGGMISTNDSRLAEEITELRLHGLSKDAWKRYDVGASWEYEIRVPGYKTNMTDIQAAMGLIQLKRLEEMNHRREKLAQAYSERLELIDGIVTPPNVKGRCWHIYHLRVANGLKQRNNLIKALNRRGIGTSVHFISLHLQPAYARLGYHEGDFPVSEAASSSIVSVPLFPDMTLEEVERVCNAITEEL